MVVGAQIISCGSSGSARAANDSGKCSRTAAQTLGWGSPYKADEFTNSSTLSNWVIYNSVGHDGNGRRTPSAITVSDGALVVTGDASGNSGGMAESGGGQKYGRWEICTRSPAAAPGYHAVALLWPDNNMWPIGGEVDFMEISDPARQSAEYNLHYGMFNSVESHRIEGDGTQWHAFAVNWTPSYIAVYVDGFEWARTTAVSKLPPWSMHLCLQLDNFGGNIAAGGKMYVDWARSYRP
ncbi:glycoside hydrolase family 16 protein [Gordonia otitidis]|uniref:glycoside hydrolase family 16 protein n=1 Tax=Gordonia otitidis TaxID=249058 RepID=UPI001F487A54|nr:glycoside hydrolase family 16 protein [Gordonia otitidis]